MVLSEYDKEWLAKTFIELYNLPISKMFRYPVDQIKDHALNYYEIVKKPMCLDTIKKKLNAGAYDTIDDFSDDLRLIYNNSILFNQKNSVITWMAADMVKWFNERRNKKGVSKEVVWNEKVQKICKKIAEHMTYNKKERMPVEALFD